MGGGRKMRNGIVYIAFGNKCMRELEYSVKTLRKTHPNLKITLFSDKIPDNDQFDFVKLISADSVRVKQKFLLDSPYDNTLYLDTDTAILGPIEETFRIMERFDMAATHDLIRKDAKKSAKYPDYAKIPDGFPEFGGGVILFRKSTEVERFFDVWQRNFKKWYELTGEVRDQPSFRVSVWQCQDLKFFVLPPEFNHRTKKHNNIITRIKHEHNMWRK